MLSPNNITFAAFLVSLLPEPRHLLPGFCTTLCLLAFYAFRLGYVGARTASWLRAALRDSGRVRARECMLGGGVA